MTKCYYCDKEATTCFRYLGKWMCEGHAEKYNLMRFKDMLDKANKENDDLLKKFEKEMKQ